MHLEQSIHDANDLTLSIVRGETSTWTVFKVEVEGVMLEFTAFGELPLTVEVFDDVAIPDLVDFLSDQGAIIDSAKAGRRAAEQVCDNLRADLEADRFTLAAERHERELLVKRTEAAEANESEATETRMYSEGLLADATAELRTANEIQTSLDLDIATKDERIAELESELKQSRDILAHVQERGFV